ncbi:MAG: SPOR domain-containing protein [Pseudobdellovibrionaceae bacterium]|jgi:cell division protein FtsN
MAAQSDSNSPSPAPTAPNAPASGRSPAHGSGKGQAMMKLVLVFFISLFSFAVGTYVGKTYSDQHHKTAALEPKNHLAVAKSDSSHHEEENHESSGLNSLGDHPAREIASAASAKPSQEMMTDDEIARLAEEYVSDDEAPAAKKTDSEEGHHAASDVKDHDKVDKAAHSTKHAVHSDAKQSPVAKKPILPEDSDSRLERVPASPADKKKPMEAMNEKIEKNSKPEIAKGRKPSSLPPNPIQDSIGKYTVQIASFATEDEAKQRAAQLRTQGFNAFYVQALVKGNIWFRVSIGLFNSERDAKNYMVDYRKGNSAIQAIVQKISAE